MGLGWIELGLGSSGREQPYSYSWTYKDISDLLPSLKVGNDMVLTLHYSMLIM